VPQKNPFKLRKGVLDCNASDMLDALTILFDLGMWNEEMMEKALADPAKFPQWVLENQTEIYKKWVERNPFFTPRLIGDYGNKIQAIKTLKLFARTGLSISKTLIESLPVICPWRIRKYNVEDSTFLNAIKPCISFELVECEYDHGIFEDVSINKQVPMSLHGEQSELFSHEFRQGNYLDNLDIWKKFNPHL
jgi:hypothetical protein